MYRQNHSNQQSESLQRDALISALKKELYDLRDKQHEYVTMTDDVHKYQTRYSMQKQEKERKENQQSIKIDINRKNIGQLRNQIDSLKMQIHKCSVHIEDVLREGVGIRRAVDNRENQIANLMSADQELEAKNQQMNQQNKAVAGKIKSLKDERNKIDSQSQRLQRLLEDTINTLKGLEKEARFLESSNNKLSSMLIVAEKDHSDLMSEMKNRDDMVSSTNKKLEQLNRQIEELRDKINKLEKECVRNQKEFKNANQQLDGLTTKNKQQSKKIKQSQNILRGVENELDTALLDLQSIHIDNGDLNAEHKLLNSQIDSILLQIIECEKVNNEMNREIENYIQYDQDARNMLDRKTKMRKMLETVSTRLGQTGSNIAHLR